MVWMYIKCLNSIFLLKSQVTHFSVRRDGGITFERVFIFEYKGVALNEKEKATTKYVIWKSCGYV